MSEPQRPSSDDRTGWDPVWTGLLLLLVLCPIPFGSNRPWAWSAMALWSSLLLGSWAILLLLGRRRLVWRRALIVPLALGTLVAGWILLSIWPNMGPPNPIWQMASERLGRPLPETMAVSVESVLVGLMRLLAYVSIFWTSLQYTRNRKRAEQLLVWVSWAGFAMALYGLINYLAGSPYLLWYERWTAEADVTSTFVNRNHYATFSGLGMVCAMGVGISAYRAAWRLSDRSQQPLARMIECLAGRPIVYFVIMLVIGMAWLQTHSRMGTAAVSLGLVMMLILMMTTGLVRRRVAQWVTVVVLGFFLVQVSGELTFQRISETAEINRLPIFSVVSDQIAGAPLTGSGYGSFAQTFNIYRDLRLPTPAIYLTAHNSYLELAAEIGIPAAALLVLAIAWCLMLCIIGAYRRRRDAIFPIIGVAATIVVGSHALLDFSLQIPAIAALYAAILAMGVAQSWSTDEEQST